MSKIKIYSNGVNINRCHSCGKVIKPGDYFCLCGGKKPIKSASEDVLIKGLKKSVLINRILNVKKEFDKDKRNIEYNYLNEKSKKELVKMYWRIKDGRN